MRATDIISEVARKAGVDRRTAKNVLEGKPAHHLTRKAVNEALADLRAAAEAQPPGTEKK